MTVQRHSVAAPKKTWPLLGCGVGLRPPHYAQILAERPAMDWFEATTENFMDSGGRPIQVLEEVRRRYPVVLHGVSLSIGSADPLSERYLERLEALVRRIEPAMVSDHLCWTGVGRRNLHDLLPLPFTEEAVGFIVGRVQEVQERLGRPIVLENVSSYVTYKHSAMPEWEFLSEVARRSGCGILLDLNNVYVNSVNHKFDPQEYLRGIPAEKVAQFHLAGHTDMGDFLFDTHSAEVIGPIWTLYREALSLYGPVSTLIEWDENIPAWERLAGEAAKARAVYRRFEADFFKEGGERSEKDFRPSRQRARPTPPGLRETQEDLVEHLRGGRAFDPAAEKFIQAPAASGKRRLEAYAGGYHVRIHDALAEVYEATRHLLGEEAFHALAHAYADAHPSGEYNLTHVGRSLPEFLKAWPMTEKLGFLPDLAGFEWKVSEAFHAFDGPPASAASLSALSSEDAASLKIQFQPSLRLFASEWPVLDLWEARKTPLGEIDIDLTARPQRGMIHRRGFEVRGEAMDGARFDFLKSLAEGRTLGDAIEALPESDEPPPLGPWFSDWAGRGLILNFRLK